MRVLGIDLGEKSMGLAVTDNLQICASGIENFVHEHNDLNSCVNRLIY
jgi:RNase H-fold protein (predicted Holliday junction resolvase)